MRFLGDVLCLLLLFGCGQASAAATVDPAAWAAEAWPKLAASGAKVPRNLLVLRGLNGPNGPQFAKTDSAAFNVLSYLRILSGDDAGITYRLSARKDTMQNPEGVAKQLFTMLDVDALIVGKDAGTDWRMVWPSMQANVDASSPALSTKSMGSVLQWIQRQLGYQAVVLAVDGDQVLVGGAVSQLVDLEQAAVLGNSWDQDLLPEDGHPAVAILSKVSQQRELAIFRVVLSRAGANNNLRAGAKVIFFDP